MGLTILQIVVAVLDLVVFAIGCYVILLFADRLERWQIAIYVAAAALIAWIAGEALSVFWRG